MIEAEVLRYSDPEAFAREVNLPLLGSGAIPPVPAGAPVSTLLAVQATPDLARVVDGLDETRRTLTLRSLLLAGFQEDPEVFAIGLAIAREWSRRGRKIAVVDLDFWNPTVLRPLPQANEGLVDALEYGCSFRRIAWEIVAGSLWVVGPGSYPPDPSRLSEHPDWDRLARGLSAHVDVALFVAPLLERSGFVGKLSKRMDGVLLAASVERIARADLRDAFLELWGSDAPMIGCVGIQPGVAMALVPAREEDEAPSPPPGAAAGVMDGLIGVPASGQARSEPVMAESDSVQDLTEVLDREVRLGRSTVKPIRRPRSGLYAALGVAFSVLAVILAFVAKRPSLDQDAKEALPTGMEPVLPAPEQPLSAGMGQSPSALPGADALPGGTAGVTPGSAALPDQRADEPTTPSPTSAAQPPTSRAQPPTADRPFRVHVASFRSAAKVRAIVAALQAHGEDAWYERAADAPFYRVFVGRFATEDEARAYAQKLLERGWVDRATPYPQTKR